MQFFGYTINCGLTERVSGLWHHLHAILHPLKNTVVRIPGPSFSENRSISVITPFISCSPFFGIFAPRKQGRPSPSGGAPLLRWILETQQGGAAPYSIITSSSCLGLPAQFLEGNLSSQPGRLVKGLDHGHHIHNLILLDRIFLYGHFSVEHLQNVVHFVNMSGKI